MIVWQGLFGAFPNKDSPTRPHTVQFLMLLLTALGSAAVLGFGRAAEHCAGKDPSLVVADETAGQALVLMLGVPWVPWTPPPTSWPMVFGRQRFVLFRIFDILNCHLPIEFKTSRWIRHLVG